MEVPPGRLASQSVMGALREVNELGTIVACMQALDSAGVDGSKPEKALISTPDDLPEVDLPEPEEGPPEDEPCSPANPGDPSTDESAEPLRSGQDDGSEGKGNSSADNRSKGPRNSPDSNSSDSGSSDSDNGNSGHSQGKSRHAEATGQLHGSQGEAAAAGRASVSRFEASNNGMKTPGQTLAGAAVVLGTTVRRSNEMLISDSSNGHDVSTNPNSP